MSSARAAAAAAEPSTLSVTVTDGPGPPTDKSNFNFAINVTEKSIDVRFVQIEREALSPVVYAFYAARPYLSLYTTVVAS